MWTERRSDANEPFLIFSPWCLSDPVQHRLENDDLENNGLENDDLENDDLENNDLENDDLENKGLENDDLENDDLESDDRKYVGDLWYRLSCDVSSNKQWKKTLK